MYAEDQLSYLEFTTKYEYCNDKKSKDWVNVSSLKEEVEWTLWDSIKGFVEISLNKHESEKTMYDLDLYEPFKVKLETEKNYGIGGGIRGTLHTFSNSIQLSGETKFTYIQHKLDKVMLDDMVSCDIQKDDIDVYIFEASIYFSKDFVTKGKYVTPYFGIKYEHTTIKMDISFEDRLIAIPFASNSTDKEDKIIPKVGVKIRLNENTELLFETEYYDSDFRVSSGIKLRF
ncbi:MAG: outer membrane beta-barrel protein [Candidatus Thorarchaeota archaeon]